MIDIEVIDDLISEPLDLPEAKAYLRIDGTDEDDVITSLIQTARGQLEQYTGLSFGEKEIRLYVDYLPCSYRLPYGPIESVDSVVSNDADIDFTTVGGYHKTVKTDGGSSVYITYTTKDFADLHASMKAAIKGAMKAQVAYMYNNRGDAKGEVFAGKTNTSISDEATQILFPHVQLNLF